MDYMLNPIYQLLSSSPQIHACLYLAHSIGMEETQILSVLIAKSTWYINNEYDDEGWFYCTQKDLEQSTTYGRKTQESAIKHLIAEGLIEYKVAGVPAKRYFRIPDAIDKLAEFISLGMEKYNSYNEDKTKKNPIKGNNSSLPKKDILERPKRTNMNDQVGHSSSTQPDIVTYKNNNKKDYNKKNMVVSAENTDGNIIEQIVSHLNEKAGTAYRPKSAETKRLILARLNEGFTLDDFIKVIDKKCAEWLNTDMAKYLRPSTLFGEKFESYLNAPVSETVKKEVENSDKMAAYLSLVNRFSEETIKAAEEPTVEDMLTQFLGGSGNGG